MINLERFLAAQDKGVFVTALSEIRAGRKRSHWMWYIFPQMKGLGFSETSQYYAIYDLSEAKAYLNHEILGNRLIEITSALLVLPDKNAAAIFGKPDDKKLHSSMTLFSQADNSNTSLIFNDVLKYYFNNKPDMRTLEILKKEKDYTK